MTPINGNLDRDWFDDLVDLLLERPLVAAVLIVCVAFLVCVSVVL